MKTRVVFSASLLLRLATAGCSSRQVTLPLAAGGGPDAIDAYFEANPDASPNELDRDGSSALHIAISLHDARTVLALLPHRPNLEQKDARGRTPLFYAAQLGHVEEAGALLLAGADPSSANGVEKDTPLHAAALGAPLGISELLLARGADANSKNAWGQTPLFDAMRAPWAHGEAETALLLAHGADVAIADQQGFTALHVAAAHDNYRAIRLLLSAHADASSKSHVGNTPLDVALEQHRDLAAEALFEAHAPRNLSSIAPPLFQAAEADDQDWTLHLLSFGFDAALSVDGVTAMDVARAHHSKDALSLLARR